jgi:hypothetical protein
MYNLPAPQITGEIGADGPTVPTSALSGVINDDSVSIDGAKITSQTITSDQVHPKDVYGVAIGVCIFKATF